MRHVVTLITQPANVSGIRAVVTALKLEPHWLHEPCAADIFFDRTPGVNWFAILKAACAAAGVDYISQTTSTRKKKLLIADMDSTMIHQECIDEMADCLGLKQQVAAITHQAMSGKLDFAAALRERVALLKGLPEQKLQEVFDKKITLMGGARTLVRTMKKWGGRTVLVSGGFQFFTSRVAAAIGFDHEEANRLEVKAGLLTGKVIEPILDKKSKQQALIRFCAQYGLQPTDALAVGDGANDLPMLQSAGMGIAYRAKPMVREEAKACVTYNDLTALLYAQGIPKKDWVTA